MKEEAVSRYWIDNFVKELVTLDLIKLGYLYKPIIELRIYVRSFGEDAPGIRVEYGTEESISDKMDDTPVETKETEKSKQSAGQEKEGRCRLEKDEVIHPQKNPAEEIGVKL